MLRMLHRENSHQAIKVFLLTGGSGFSVLVYVLLFFFCLAQQLKS